MLHCTVRFSLGGLQTCYISCLSHAFSGMLFLLNALLQERTNWAHIFHGRIHSMRKYTRRLVVASALALTMVTAPVAHAEDQILASVPGLTFPFFVHMMNAFKAEAAKQGVGVIESDGQVSSPKQTADVEA